MDHCRRQHVGAHSYELDSPVTSNSIALAIRFRERNIRAGMNRESNDLIEDARAMQPRGA